MNLTPFQASKLVEWAEWELAHDPLGDLPRGLQEVLDWIYSITWDGDVPPFPKFDTEQPYTWEG